jgi:hypothetical protein
MSPLVKREKEEDSAVFKISRGRNLKKVLPSKKRSIASISEKPGISQQIIRNWIKTGQLW